MAIPTAYRPTPIPELDGNVPIVDPKTGLPTIQFLQAYDRFRQYINGGNRVIPCSASTTSNKITLTPNDASPLIEGYRDFDIFPFVADATSSGTVTATVVPANGTLATLKVYKTDGAAQATTSDIVSGSFYLLCFVDTLDSSAGGLVLK